MVINIHEVVDYKALADHYIIRDGYVFVCITHPGNVFDTIVIRHPQNTLHFSPQLPISSRSLDDHIALIHELQLEKALIIADSIEFLDKCPTLRHLKIIPSNNSGDGFDYSPLYNMPQIKSLRCATVYGKNEEFSTSVDCSKIKDIEDLAVCNSGYINFRNIPTLKSLALSHYQNHDLQNAFSTADLDTLLLMQCRINSLEGIQQSQKIQCLYLYYNRGLQNIDALHNVKHTLKALRIVNCPKIKDFSILGELENLELLELSGNNKLPSLSFLKSMKNLKTFTFSMNVNDGDLSPCLSLSYVYSEKNRKHYNLKDAQLPKGRYVRGNESIEQWRRLE